MKNYIFGWQIKERGFVEVLDSDYTLPQVQMKVYIDALSAVLVKANCGWDALKYKVMQNKYGIETFMVLCVGDFEERWIPITGNSKGANLQVLGENIW